MNATSQKFTEADAGCYFDSARGIYIGEAVIEFAENLGFRVDIAGYTPEDRLADGKGYLELWEDAEIWLNDPDDMLPEDYYFGSTESGDWGLWHNCDDEDRVTLCVNCRFI